MGLERIGVERGPNVGPAGQAAGTDGASLRIVPHLSPTEPQPPAATAPHGRPSASTPCYTPWCLLETEVLQDLAPLVLNLLTTDYVSQTRCVSGYHKSAVQAETSGQGNRPRVEGVVNKLTDEGSDA